MRLTLEANYELVRASMYVGFVEGRITLMAAGAAAELPRGPKRASQC
jgi:hypothetical protein